MILNDVKAVTLRYFTEVGKSALQKTICGGIYARVYCILARVQCRRKESSRSLSHLLMSFLQSVPCYNAIAMGQIMKWTGACFSDFHSESACCKGAHGFTSQWSQQTDFFSVSHVRPYTEVLIT